MKKVKCSCSIHDSASTSDCDVSVIERAMNDEVEGIGRKWQCADRDTAVTTGHPDRTAGAGASAEIRHDHLYTHKPLSSLLSGESYELRIVSWLQVECSPQMRQTATYSVCSCVIIQIGST